MEPKNEDLNTNEIEILCRLRDEKLKDLSPDMDISTDIREKWITSITEAFKTGSEGLQTIRPWDIRLYLDGRVDVDLTSQAAISNVDSTIAKVYPIRYQKPSNSLENFPSAEHPLLIERFALGCLIYEISTLRKPYADLSDDEVKTHYNEGKYPENPVPATHNSSFLSRAGSYVRAHPVLFGLQVAGAGVAAASVIALPILGFGAAGPVAGSIAAGWQSSLGVVQAGSLFAWCQGAAMGGAAAGGLAGIGVAGAGVTGAATAAAVPGVKEKVAGAFKDASDAIKDPGWQEKVKGSVKGAADTITGMFRTKDDGETKP